MANKRQRETVLWLSACAVTVALTLAFAGNARAQNQSGGQPAPVPTPASGATPTSPATDPLSQIVTTLSRDMARRAELALTMRY